MSSKKYTDFPAGTYNTAKIFLQADATTGALEKVNLPTITSGYSQNTLVDANNSGSNPQTIGSLVVPSSVLDVIGKTIHIVAVGEILSSTGTPQLGTSFESLGGLTVVGSTTGSFQSDYYIVRTSSTTVKGYGRITRVNSISASSNTFVITLATGNTGTFRLIQSVGAANTMYVLSINAAA